jgi:SlyX protein
MNDKITELENRLAFQEDAIHELNLTIARQQNMIETLQRVVVELRQQVGSLTPEGGGGGEMEIPPHY